MASVCQAGWSQRLVELVHVGLVVLVVVQAQGGRVDVRFERLVGVGQRRHRKRVGGHDSRRSDLSGHQ